MIRALAIAATLTAACGLGGCVRVRPHQRETLSHPALQQPPWSQPQAAAQHVFQIREGTEGAVDVGGGGCGCN